MTKREHSCKIDYIYIIMSFSDIDECKLGYHDCHEKAVCTNTFESYKCRCKKGWRGYGRLEVWANGRNCTGMSDLLL